ncbi:MAG TPA: sulfatase-like hydrolase/transferase, partial [Bacteroidia bacterium]|nr:sulfatase-like hydrolase/transferase [Bacteroidia bacterium]
MAKRLFITILKHYLFWIVLFLIGRIIFLAWNSEELTGIPLGEVLLSLPVALYLDTAMACYLLIIPFVFSLLSLALRKPALLKINNGIHLVFLVAFFLLVLAELSIYDEWHKKLDYKALWFFGNPAEVFHTASWSQLLSCFLGTAVLAGLSYWIYKKYITEKTVAERSHHWSIFVYALSIPCLLIIGIRGGFQTIPIQLSDAYYSKHDVLNLASVNSVFNLASSCIENANAGEPYRFVSPEEAAKVFAELHYTAKDTTVMLLNTTRPNIVLVVLEGWSADMVKSCGGFAGVTPYFDQMAEQGFLFNNCYASGSLSDQGMAAVFSGFPAQPRTSIITQPTKYQRLPCISKKFEEAGYKTSFMFGGQLSYGNIRSYMYYNDFNKIIEGEDFPAEIPQGKLGVADEYLFSRQLSELKKETQPF